MSKKIRFCCPAALTYNQVETKNGKEVLRLCLLFTKDTYMKVLEARISEFCVEFGKNHDFSMHKIEEKSPELFKQVQEFGYVLQKNCGFNLQKGQLKNLAGEVIPHTALNFGDFVIVKGVFASTTYNGKNFASVYINELTVLESEKYKLTPTHVYDENDKVYDETIESYRAEAIRNIQADNELEIPAPF